MTWSVAVYVRHTSPAMRRRARGPNGRPSKVVSSLADGSREGFGAGYWSHSDERERCMVKSPDIPADEAERLGALRAMRVLDTDPEERFDRFTRLAKRLFGVPIALVSLVDADRQWFKSRQGLEVTETPRELSFCGHAILAEDAMVVSDALDDERFADNPLVVEDPNIRFYAGSPLATPDGFRVGTLCLIDRKPREFDQEDRGLLSDLARMVEEELANAALATTDELTGIANRRGFLAIGHPALARAKRERIGATLIYIDLDRFKRINDEHGHAAGDEALRTFARLLLMAFRDSDVIARLGGDEFCVLMLGTGSDAATRVMERFTTTLSNWNRDSGKPWTLACSMGLVAFRPEQDGTLESLLGRADECMYEHKRNRR